jgi:transcription antitermination factor NusG
MRGNLRQEPGPPVSILIRAIAPPAVDKRQVMSAHSRTEGGNVIEREMRPEAQWFAIWTHSHCETLVRDQLHVRGFNAYLPTIRTWSRRAGKQHLIQRPMFPGYLFVRQAMDKQSYVEIVKTRGIVRILAGGWDRLEPVPDNEIESLRRVLSADLPVLPHPYLRAGQHVRIQEGSLAGLEGILVRSRPNRGLVVLSVDLLRQSVAVEVDCTLVGPAGSSFIGVPQSGSRLQPAAAALHL